MNNIYVAFRQQKGGENHAKRNICEPIRNMKDVQDMLEVLRTREHGFRDALLFEVGLSTALRVSDILSLKNPI